VIKLDETDKRLLRALQDDSDINVKELASRLSLTKTPIYERIKRYVRDGIIKKYVAVLDLTKVGNSMVIFCSVSLESQKLEAIEAFGRAVERIPEVIECYLMGGANDFLLKIVVQDLEDYHRFSSGKLAALPNVSQIKSSFVINEVKRSTVMPVY
jgi:Lrp/AsnC family transcriptional regulator